LKGRGTNRTRDTHEASPKSVGGDGRALIPILYWAKNTKKPPEKKTRHRNIHHCVSKDSMLELGCLLRMERQAREKGIRESRTVAPDGVG